MKQPSVYILKCSDGSYYTGVTNDLDRRLIEHTCGENETSYTYNKRPLEFVFQEDFIDAAQAIEFEKQVKGWRREKKEALIKREWEKSPELSISFSKRNNNE